MEGGERGRGGGRVVPPPPHIGPTPPARPASPVDDLLDDPVDDLLDDPVDDLLDDLLDDPVDDLMADPDADPLGGGGDWSEADSPPLLAPISAKVMAGVADFLDEFTLPDLLAIFTTTMKRQPHNTGDKTAVIEELVHNVEDVTQILKRRRVKNEAMVSHLHLNQVEVGYNVRKGSLIQHMIKFWEENNAPIKRRPVKVKVEDNPPSDRSSEERSYREKGRGRWSKSRSRSPSGGDRHHYHHHRERSRGRSSSSDRHTHKKRERRSNSRDRKRVLRDRSPSDSPYRSRRERSTSKIRVRSLSRDRDRKIRNISHNLGGNRDRSRRSRSKSKRNHDKGQDFLPQAYYYAPDLPHNMSTEERYKHRIFCQMDRNTETDDLINFFIHVGEVQTIHLFDCQYLQPRRLGYIEFRERSSVAKAFEFTRGKRLLGSPLIVQNYRPRKNWVTQDNKREQKRKRYASEDQKEKFPRFRSSRGELRQEEAHSSQTFKSRESWNNKAHSSKSRYSREEYLKSQGQSSKSTNLDEDSDWENEDQSNSRKEKETHRQSAKLPNLNDDWEDEDESIQRENSKEKEISQTNSQTKSKENYDHSNESRHLNRDKVATTTTTVPPTGAPPSANQNPYEKCFFMFSYIAIHCRQLKRKAEEELMRISQQENQIHNSNKNQTEQQTGN